MPRTGTPAAERAAQRAKAQDEVAASTGHPVSVREAAAFKREQNNVDTLAQFDRLIDTGGVRTTDLGHAICKVQDLKVLRGSAVVLGLLSSVEYFNALARAGTIGGDFLMVSFTQIHREFDEDGE